jgi:hypothetical protein
MLWTRLDSYTDFHCREVLELKFVEVLDLGLAELHKLFIVFWY